MIIELILVPIKFVLTGILNIINTSSLSLPTWANDMANLLNKALMFFPPEVFVITILNISFWITVQFAWAIIEWIYKKIPGVN